MQNRNNSAAQDQGNPVFENRNKAYGAFELRNSYEKRLTAGLASTVGLFLIAFLGLLNLNSEKIHGIVSNGNYDVPVFDTTVIKLDDNIKIVSDAQKQDETKDVEVKVVKDENKTIDSISHKPNKMLTQIAGIGTGKGQGTISGNTGGGGLGKFKAPLLTLKKEPMKYETFYDSPPSFPGGRDAYEEYVNKHMQYPNDGVFIPTGRIILSLSIDPSGNIVDVELVKGIGYGYDEEAIKVIRSMPQWIPAKRNGVPIPLKYTSTILIER